MPSFDNIYDLTESLDAEKVDHFIVTIQKPGSSTNGKPDIFYRLSSRESLEAFCAVMDNLINNERDKFVIEPPPPAEKEGRRLNHEEETKHLYSRFRRAAPP